MRNIFRGRDCADGVRVLNREVGNGRHGLIETFRTRRDGGIPQPVGHYSVAAPIGMQYCLEGKPLLRPKTGMSPDELEVTDFAVAEQSMDFLNVLASMLVESGQYLRVSRC